MIQKIFIPSLLLFFIGSYSVFLINTAGVHTQVQTTITISNNTQQAINLTINFKNGRGKSTSKEIAIPASTQITTDIFGCPISFIAQNPRNNQIATVENTHGCQSIQFNVAINQNNGNLVITTTPAMTSLEESPY